MQRPNPFFMLFAAVVIAAAPTVATFAQDGGQDRQRGPAAREGRAAPGGPGAGGPGAAARGGDWTERLMGPDASMPFITLITELNMTPRFTLSPEQKERIQTLREEFREARQSFTEEHRPQFERIQGQISEARESRDRQAMAEAFESLRELTATGPTGDKLLEDIRAVLTEEQLQIADEVQNERQERLRRMMREQRERGQREGGQRGDRQQGPDI